MEKKTQHSAAVLPVLLLFLLAAGIQSPGAQEAEVPAAARPVAIEYNGLGDQVFSINAGPFFPLFIHNPSPEKGEDSVTSSNLSIGGTGALYYGAYLNNNVQLGIEIGAMFAQSPNDNNFYMVPITFRGTYEFQLMNNLFTIPLYLGAGMSMTSYLDDFHVDMILKPGAGFYWNYSSSWSFGTNATYWWVPQIYPADKEYNRIGNFTDVSLSAKYNF